MKRYKKTFLGVTILLTVMSIVPLLAGISEQNIFQVLVCAGVPSVMWFAYDCLQNSRRGAFTFSFILASIPCVLMIARVFERRQFIVENGGMERPDGYGSPMAFLMGLAFEIIVLMVFSVIVMHGISVLCRRRLELLADDV